MSPIILSGTDKDERYVVSVYSDRLTIQVECWDGIRWFPMRETGYGSISIDTQTLMRLAKILPLI